jgi:hypothetical protein
MAGVSPLEISESAVRADVENAGNELVKLRSSWFDLDEERRSRIIRNTLAACAYEGPGALDAGQVLRLTAPLRAPLLDPATRSMASELLNAVARRAALVESSKMLEQLLGEYGAQRFESEVRTSDDDFEEPFQDVTEQPESAIDFGALTSTRVGVLPADTTLEALATAWLSVHGDYAIEVQAQVNTWLLRSAILTRRSLSLEYCDQLRSDDFFWGSAAAKEMAGSLGQPFPSDVFGELEAACLNSRLRALRPRLFLTHPDTMIIAPIGESSDGDASAEAMLEEISYPILRCFMTIQGERNRGGDARPRKTTMKELEGYLEDVLLRFGVRLIGQVGEKVHFDPEVHQALRPVEPGQDVIVVQPGLRQRGSDVMQIPVTVQDAANPAADDADNNDDVEGPHDHQ